MHKSIKKSQSMVLEQVMLFAMGIAILVACIGIFTIYQNAFTTVSSLDQLDMVKDFIVSSIIKLAQSGNETNSSMVFSIPKRIGDEFYEINLTNQGLSITNIYTGTSRFSPIYNLNNSMNFSGTVISRGGRFIIYKKGNKIIIT